jgi:aldehyde dehydrogenase (NAD+)
MEPEQMLTVDTARALASSLKDAFDSGRTRRLAWRIRQLEGIERMMVEREERLAAALHQDLGKSAAEAWLTETSFVAHAARHARRNLPRWTRDKRVPTPVFALPGRSWIRSEPLGTVLNISPWNYPLQLSLAPLVTVVAAGNCAVLKPSELAPATAALVADLVPEYLDGDCIRVVAGGVPEATLLLEQRWDHIIFTGGAYVARIVMAAAARHLTPVTLELGGKSPCIVLPDADLEIAARRIAWGKCTNAGQTCIAPDYVLTDAPTMQALVPLLQQAIRDMYGDDPGRCADYGRIVSDGHFDRITGLLEGGAPVHGGAADRERRYIEPTIVAPADPDSALMQEEIFGPVLPIVETGDLQAALDFILARPKPLAAYLFSKSTSAAERVVSELSSGSICINDVMMFMAVDELPFGGVGASGTATYKGEPGFRQLSHQKAVLRRGWKPDWRLRYAPFTGHKVRWLRRLR